MITSQELCKIIKAPPNPTHSQTALKSIFKQKLELSLQREKNKTKNVTCVQIAIIYKESLGLLNIYSMLVKWEKTEILSDLPKTMWRSIRYEIYKN